MASSDLRWQCEEKGKEVGGDGFWRTVIRKEGKRGSIFSHISFLLSAAEKGEMNEWLLDRPKEGKPRVN